VTVLEVAKSTAELAWALGAFGAQQVLRVLPAGLEAGNSLRTSVYQTTEAAQHEFEQIAPLFFAYQVGNRVERMIANFAADALSLRILSPGYLIDVWSSLAESTEDALKSLGSSEARRLYAQQFRNNFAVVDFVNQSDAPTRLSADGSYPLDKRVRNCYEGEHPERDWPALWKVEGVGERFAAAHLHASPNPRDLMTGVAGLNQPEKARLMLHSGMGLAFAKDVVRTITPWSSNAEFERALRRFIELCRENSQKGYVGAALQSLGLVTQTWHRQMVEPVSKHLQKIDPLAREFFWRAAGGAMYFSPLNWLPGWSPYFTAETEPADRSAKQNARAGVACPFTIVNLRQPGIMANFLKRKSNEIKDKDAWLNGVLSALIMASESVPGPYYVAKFCEYQPKDSAGRNRWNEYIGSDLMARVDSYRETLKKYHRMDEIFRYQNLAGLVLSLESGEENSSPEALTAR
jgi:hypothetical protein